MRLSDAIRLGAMMKPQAFGAFLHIKDGESRTCAWGSAFDAVGLLDNVLSAVTDEDDNAFWSMWGLDEEYHDCPACNFNQNTKYLIVHLNDLHQWTREQIADWIATVEPRVAQETEAEVPA